MTARATRNRLVTLVAFVLVFAGVASLDPEARGFESSHPSVAADFPDFDLDYSFETGFPTAMQTAIKRDDINWEDYGVSAGDSGTFSLAYDPAAVHELRWVSSGPAGTPAFVPPFDVPCTDGDCEIVFNSDLSWHTSATLPPVNVLDIGGLAVHEFGHWFGVNHNNECTGSGHPDYSPDPYNDMDTMCYDNSILSGGLQRTPAQDDIQGATYMLYKKATVKRWFAANGLLSMCGDPPGTSTNSGCIPTYWEVDPLVGTHTWETGGNGRLLLDASSTNPTVELIQKVDGADVDLNNNGNFRFHFRAKSVAGTPTVTLFIRNWNDTSEHTCTQQITTTWTTYNCHIDTVGTALTEYEYGMRVTADVWITRILIRDKVS